MTLLEQFESDFAIELELHDFQDPRLNEYGNRLTAIARPLGIAKEFIRTEMRSNPSFLTEPHSKMSQAWYRQLIYTPLSALEVTNHHAKCSQRYSNTTQSHKSCTTYMIGQALTAYLSDSLFGVSHIYDYDKYTHLWSNSIQEGNSGKAHLRQEYDLIDDKIPDFIGETPNGEYFIIEAKARSKPNTQTVSLISETRKRGLRSVVGIGSIDGVSPFRLFFWFGLNRNKIKGKIFDPNSRESVFGGSGSNIEKLQYYYKAFIDTDWEKVSELESIYDKEFMVIPFGSENIQFGIDKRIYDMLTSRDQTNKIFDLIDDYGEEFRDRMYFDTNIYVGRDGLVLFKSSALVE